LNYVSLPSSYVCFMFAYYILWWLSVKNRRLLRICVHTCTCRMKKKWLAIEIVDTILRIGSYFSRTTSKRLLSIGIREKKWFHSYKYCTYTYNEITHKSLAIFFLYFSINNEYTHTFRAIFLFLCSLFSSSKCQLRFGSVSLLLVSIRLHHHSTTTTS
jgi:hypothetical protein